MQCLLGVVGLRDGRALRVRECAAADIAARPDDLHVDPDLALRRDRQQPDVLGMRQVEAQRRRRLEPRLAPLVEAQRRRVGVEVAGEQRPEPRARV
jgi:hypothetical protein